MGLREAFGLVGRDRLLGLFFVVLVSCIWVFSSFLVQDIEALGVNPVIITFVSNSLFALYFPVYWLSQYIKSRRNEEKAETSDNDDFALPSLESWRSEPGVALQALFQNPLFRAACQVAPLWFFAQLTFNMSLSRTSVTSNTILSSASSLFTFLFSVLLLSERFTYFKLSCIMALMVGTGMVTYSDATSHGTQSSSSSLFGDILCLISAVLYGLYTVNIRKQIQGDDEAVPMTLFFGMMGTLIACIVGPMLAWFAMLGFSFGTLGWSIFGILILKGCLDNVLSDYLWARSILLIGPTLATSGLALQVPIAVVSDALIKHPAWMNTTLTILLTMLGGCIILGAFFGLNTNDSHEKLQQEEEEGEVHHEHVPLARRENAS